MFGSFGGKDEGENFGENEKEGRIKQNLRIWGKQ